METRITVFKSTQTFRLNFKKQLIEAEAARLGGFQSRQIITGQDSTPVEIAPGGRDFRTTQEEADMQPWKRNIIIVTDDTDIYILLLYHNQTESLDIPMKF